MIDSLSRFIGHHPPAWRPLLKRDPCAYCHQPEAGTIDHIRPRRRATRTHRHGDGRNTIDNLTGACPACNVLKDDWPLLMFLARHGYPVRRPPNHGQEWADIDTARDIAAGWLRA